MQRYINTGIGQKAVAIFLFFFVILSGFVRATDPYPCPNQPKTVVVLGDSLADGIWGSLWRGWQTCPNIILHRVTSVSDGLARTSATEWISRLDEVDPIDVIIIQLGGNDLRRIRDSGATFHHGTDEWNNIYADRVEALSEAAKEIAPYVFWIGLPIVGKAKMDEQYGVLSQIYATVLDCGSWWACRNSQVTFVDIYEATQFGSDAFVRSATIDGRAQILRAPDQVHFTERGYDLVVTSFIDELIKALSR